jgi:hypothetical protein
MTNSIAPFTVWYFKASGKWYEAGQLPGKYICNESVPPIADMNYACDQIESLLKENKPLPGLYSSLSEGWSAVINHPEGFPIMITAKVVDEIILNRGKNNDNR